MKLLLVIIINLLDLCPLTLRNPINKRMMKSGTKLSEAAIGARQVIIPLKKNVSTMRLRAPNLSARAPPIKLGNKLP